MNEPQDKPMPDIEMLLMLFSEWLDAEMGLMVDPDANPLAEDPLTHHDLVSLFLEHGKVNGYRQYKVEAIEDGRDAS
jgi:hypothetical protein